MSTGFAGRAVRAWRRLEAFHEEWFAARWRHALQREDRRQADTFRAMLLLHSLGVDVPVAYETLTSSVPGCGRARLASPHGARPVG